MANTSISLTALDFDSLKSNFKDYLTSQSVFKDYNFEGSNMNVLLDVMSYNSYLNAFYLNMVASEMFLDSALKLDSVVSHAKELNYLPKSAKSAVANVSFTVVYDGSPLTIPKGTVFSGQNSNGSFSFTTAFTQNYTSYNNTYQVENLQIHEGFFIQDSFVRDYTVNSQRFVLSNQNIDIDSLTVTVKENGINKLFSRVETLYNLTSNSNIYFLQAAQNSQYEIVFGDGILGKDPLNLSTIVADYRVTNGDKAQSVSSFIITTKLGNQNSTTSTITTVAPAAGGSAADGIESIRKLAPRYFATQQRAVASDDYASLVLDKFGGVISDVNVYGGQLLEPKQYGRVAVCLKPAGSTIAPNYIKDQIISYLIPYVSLPTRVIITDPDYMYISIVSEVQYEPTKTYKLASEIKTSIINSIKQYSIEHIEVFQNDFRYSKFVGHIDSVDESITSNNTEISIIKRWSPSLNFNTSKVLEFNNSAEAEGISESLGYKKGNPFYDEPIITTSAFTYIDSYDQVWDNCYIRDDNFGVLVVYKIIDNVFTVLNSAIGNVNYDTGLVTISNFKTSYYGNYISVKMKPKNKDIIASRDKILLIDLADVSINIITTQK
jgi:hypothetical protein